METHIHQRDKYGNLVSGLYAFDVEVVEKGTNLSMPVADLRFEEVVPGIQLCSFSLVEPGNFMLMISDKEQNDFISHVPYDFTVYIGVPLGLAFVLALLFLCSIILLSYALQNLFIFVNFVKHNCLLVHFVFLLSS